MQSRKETAIVKRSSVHMHEFSDESDTTRKKNDRIRRIILGLHTALIIALAITIIAESTYSNHRIDSIKRDKEEEEQVTEEILNHSQRFGEQLTKLQQEQEEQYKEIRQRLETQKNEIEKMKTSIKKLEENMTDDWENLR
jgi:uncharacterized protein HemX